MNNGLRNVGRVAACVLLGIGCAIVQLWHAPPILGGPNLPVSIGHRFDAHLITSWLWSSVNRSAGWSPWYVFSINGIVFAAFVSSLSLASYALLARRYSRGISALGAGLLGVSIGISPLCATLVLDPLGAESTLGIALFAAAVIESTGAWRFSTAARALLATAMGLQDPLLVPAAFAYACTSGARTLLDRAIPIGGATIGLAAQFAVASHFGSASAFWRIDEPTQELFAVLFGALLFLAFPPLAMALGSASRERRNAILFGYARPILLSLLAYVAGAFAHTGDASIYLLCGILGAIVCGLVEIGQRWPERGAMVALGALALIQLGALVTLREGTPALAIAKQSAYIRDAAVRDAAVGNGTCIVADALTRKRLSLDDLPLGPAIRTESIFDCPKQTENRDRLITVHGSELIDWGVSALSVARAAAAAVPPAFVLPFDQGVVTPSAHAPTPTGLGAFSQRLPTAVRRVESFTVLSTFAYSFHCIGVSAGERLSFAVTQLPKGAPTRYVVSLSEGAERSQVASGLLKTFAGQDADWTYVSAPIHQTASCATLTFAIPSYRRVPGVWVTFAGAALLP